MHLEINKIGITEKGDILIKFDNKDHTLLLKEDLLIIMKNYLELYVGGKLKY